MEKDLDRARILLESPGCTCAFCHGDAEYISRERGVKPLLDLLESGRDLRRFSAADKVVGRGAAFLYCLLGVHRIHANVLSRPALQVLESAGIRATYTALVDRIRNRTGDGLCPIESATLPCSTPEEALAVIRAALHQMRTEKK